jgi:hypothetical protein
MAHYEEQKPRKNVFNVFDMGKSFFFVRTVVELLAFLAVILAGILLWVQARHPYPSIVRDTAGHVFTPKPSIYQPTLSEALQLSKDLIEMLLTRSQDGSTLPALTPYMNDSVLAQFNAGVNNTNARVTGLYMFQALDAQNRPSPLHPSVVGTVMEVSIYTWQQYQTTSDTAYVVLQIVQEPKNRSASNPAGWRVSRINSCSRAYFIEQLKAVWRDPNLEYLKDWNRVLIPEVMGDVNLKQLLEKEPTSDSGSPAQPQANNADARPRRTQTK